MVTKARQQNTENAPNQIMIGKYQIIEEIPARQYMVYYKDFGTPRYFVNLTDAIHWCLDQIQPLTIHDYISA